MSETQEKIVTCAIEVFSRYGVRRTTMGDIAESAGVSRQTLYASYANKDEVLRAAVTQVSDNTIAEIEDAWREIESIEGKIDAYLDIAVLYFFDMLRKLPDAADLISGFREIGAEELAAAELQKQDLLEVQFQPFESKLQKHGMTPKTMAEFFQTASTNFKYVAEDRDHLTRLLASLKQTTLVMLGETSNA